MDDFPSVTGIFARSITRYFQSLEMTFLDM